MTFKDFYAACVSCLCFIERVFISTLVGPSLIGNPLYWAPLLRGYALSLLRLLCFVKLSAASFSKPIFASEPS